MQEKIIIEISRIIKALLEELNTDAMNETKKDDVIKLYQLLRGIKIYFPPVMLNEYLEFINSLEVFLGQCTDEKFLEANKEMAVSSLELLYECLGQILKYFKAHSKQCICCNSRVLYLPLPEYYNEMEKKYGSYRTGIAETLNQAEYLCPTCGASDRDRLIISYLKKGNLQKAEEGYRALQIAPAKSISQWIEKNCPQVKYETTDLFMQGVSFNSDIQNMKEIEDSTYDLIICSHVLEHVQDDQKALSEMKRIMKQNGRCIFLVPLWIDYDAIDEEWGLSEEENWKRFGQGDHCRRYGKRALLDRLEKYFYVTQLGKEYFGEEIFEQEGLTDTSNLYLLTKDQDVTLDMGEVKKIDEELAKNGPLVSVIMSCYNHADYVEEAIQSVLKQSYKNIEFIVADDGSQDHSADVMRKYSKYYAYEYYAQENVGGLYNTIKKHATGKYIALMNSDDIWDENKIALQVEYMEKHPECGVSLTWCNYVDADGKDLEGNLFIQANRNSYQWMNYFWKHGNVICNPSFLATREFGLKEERFGAACRQLPDFFKWVQIIQETEIHIIPKILVKMRRYRSKSVENVSAQTEENMLRHRMEEGCNWMWIIRQMDNAFFKKAFSDMMINPEAETDEEIRCEKYFLMLNHTNCMVQYEAFCYFNEIYVDTEKCFIDKYHYDYRNVAEDIIHKGLGKLFNV